MTRAWFIYINDVVSGPFDTDQIREQLNAESISRNSFIWWKGQREWIPIATWESQLDQILATNVERAQKPVWYMDTGVATQGRSPAGPLTQAELLENLKGLSNLKRVRLWAVGMKAWTSIFDLHEIMELLGISRRGHDRAPLMGSVAVTRSNDDPRSFMLKAASISIGGMGLTGSHDLRKGDELSLLIKSTDLQGNIHVKGEVVYVTSAGYAGIRFYKVHPEMQSFIFDYVKRFTATTSIQAA